MNTSREWTAPAAPSVSGGRARRRRPGPERGRQRGHDNHDNEDGEEAAILHGHSPGQGLLASQRHNRIDPRRAARRHVTRHERDQPQRRGDSRNVSGSLACTPKSSARMKRVSANAPARPSTTPVAATDIPCRTTSSSRSRGVGAERQPDPELARALAHEIRHHAVDADRREAEREGGEERQQQHREPPPRQRRLDALAPSSARCRSGRSGSSARISPATAAASDSPDRRLRTTTFIARDGVCAWGR